MRRILVYSHDTFGLGNIRRMLEISKHLVATDPDVSVLIMSGSPMLHAFRIPERIDYIKLPCLSRNLRGGYEVKYLDLSFDETIRLRSNIILNAIIDFAPDLILVDKKPLGVGNELAAALDLLRRRAQRPKLVLLLRDILDSPEATIPIWHRNGYFSAIETYYDQVLVVGSRDIFDLTLEYEFPRETAAKVRFCGYIKRERGKKPPEILRTLRGEENDSVVLVTAGGGEDGYALLSSYLQGLVAMDEPVHWATLMVCGPEMSEQQRRALHTLAEQSRGVAVHDFSDDMIGLMDAADLAVCMGGYNTICELLTLKKRAIIVPRVLPVQEQWIRAERMAKLGLLHAIHPDRATPQRLIAAVKEELAKINVHPRGLYQLDLNGLERIGESINSLLDHARVGSGERIPEYRQVGVQ